MIHWLFLFLVHSVAYPNQISSDSFVKITVPEVIVHAGEGSVIHVNVIIKQGFHIQANNVGDDFIIPTTLEINPAKNIIVGKQIFPLGKKFKLEGSESYLTVYNGAFEINIWINANAKIKKGVYLLKSKLHYQACDAHRCLFPRIIHFSIPVKVR